MTREVVRGSRTLFNELIKMKVGRLTPDNLQTEAFMVPVDSKSSIRNLLLVLSV